MDKNTYPLHSVNEKTHDLDSYRTSFGKHNRLLCASATGQDYSKPLIINYVREDLSGLPRATVADIRKVCKAEGTRLPRRFKVISSDPWHTTLRGIVVTSIDHNIIEE